MPVSKSPRKARPYALRPFAGPFAARLAGLWLSALGLAGLGLGCEPSYLDTIVPKDASFSLSCAPTCGPGGRDNGVVVDVTFVGHGRQFAVCCEDVPALRARLQTVNDMWCDGLEVPDKTIGGVTVGTTESKLSKKRGATLDAGDGYVSFNCDGWLPQLIDRLAAPECCG
ncbi:MAG: hypothetical protein KC731_12885 [Myxococcales bacterium]|nr:hypothetical protein [Myxococcales bacterium]